MRRRTIGVARVRDQRQPCGAVFFSSEFGAAQSRRGRQAVSGNVGKIDSGAFKNRAVFQPQAAPRPQRALPSFFGKNTAVNFGKRRAQCVLQRGEISARFFGIHAVIFTAPPQKNPQTVYNAGVIRAAAIIDFAKARAGIFARGMCMGAADLVPGVSGGTIAFITGIYGRLLAAVGAFSSPPLFADLLRFNIGAAWRRCDGNFLLALAAGILSAVALLGNFTSLFTARTRPFVAGVFLRLGCGFGKSGGGAVAKSKTATCCGGRLRRGGGAGGGITAAGCC